MFNRFFKGKDDKGSGPPGHRPSQTGGANAAEEPPGGGGFFNLPPPMKSSSAYTSPNPGQIGHSGGGTAPSGAPSNSYQRPGQQPQYGVPSYASSHDGMSSAGPSGTGSLDMFGGMSLKNPPMNVSNHAGGGSYPHPSHSHQQHGYGGAGAPSVTQSIDPQPTSLFSGLDIASGGSNVGLGGVSSFGDNNGGAAGMMLATPERRKPASRSFNYMEVAGATAASTGSMTDSTSQYGDSTMKARTSSGVISRPTGSKVVKKKKKTFRPGFGRQLSDESAAALQRGDLHQDDIIQQQVSTTDDTSSERSNSSRSMAPSATDLAHLLPPVVSGSVLKGLTVHSSSTLTSGNGVPAPSGGVLAGLTVHTASPSITSKKSPKVSRNGVLTGLNIHQQVPSTNDVDEDTNQASASVVTPEPVIKTEPSSPPPPPAPPTPEELLLNTLRDFHASAVSFRENSLKQNEEENRILKEKIRLANQLTEYEIDLRDIEAQQHHACEVEDFERADALNAAISSVRHRITLAETEVRKVDNELVAFVKSKEKAFANQLRSTRATLRELEKFRDEQEAERTALRNEYKQYEIDQTEQLQFEADRIETEMHHVSVNFEHLMSEKTEIESTIEDQCRPELAVLADLQKEKEAVEEEVRELERKLKLKLERVQEIQISIDKADKDINTVRGRYSRQLKRVAAREEGLLKAKNEVESDAEQLKIQKKEFQERLRGYESDIASFGKRITSVRKEMRTAALLASILEVQETRREQSIIRKKQQTAELSSLNDAAAIAEQSYMMLQKQHEELEKSLSIHRNAIASAESMIPRLEQEKKVAATQRNFKEAARISKDIKALEKDSATAEEMVEVVEMELQDLKERIEKRGLEYEAKKDELKNMEKQLELTTLQELWKEAKHLRVSLRKIEKYKSDGITSDDDINFRSSALLLVQAEYDACTVQIDALEKKYGVTDQAKDQDEEDDDEEVEDMDDDDLDVLSDRMSNTKSATPAYLDTDESTEVDLEAIGDGTMVVEEIGSKISELESLIEQATENEDYELAARIDEKIEVLKRRQGSIIALASRETVTEMQMHENHEDEEQEEQEEHEDDTKEAEEDVHQSELNDKCVVDTVSTLGGHSQNELIQELGIVQTHIIELEEEIEQATENEEYDKAAELDEELQSLRDEEQEIKRLLGSGSSNDLNTDHVVNDFSVDTEHIVDDKPTSIAHEGSGNGSFTGLFGGLAVSSGASVTNASMESDSTSTGAGGSLFGGLQLSSSSKEIDVTPSLEAVEDISAKEKSISPGKLSVDNSPTSHSTNVHDSFFGGLKVGGSSAPVASSSESIFGGLQLSSQSVSSAPADLPANSSSSNDEEYTPAVDTNGIADVVDSAETAEADATVEGSGTLISNESSSSEIFGNLELKSSGGDTPMTIGEISHPDDTASEMSTVVQSESSFSQMSIATTSVSSTTTSSIFGGLSVTGPSSVNVTTPTETHTEQGGHADDEEFDDTKEEATEP